MEDNFHTNMSHPNPVIDLDNVFPDDVEIEQDECPACLSKVGHKCLACSLAEEKKQPEKKEVWYEHENPEPYTHDNGNIPEGYSSNGPEDFGNAGRY